MKTSPLLEVKALTVKRGRNSLGPLSLTLSEGCGLTLVGSNGSGKSSFMLAIAGLLETTGGDVLLKLPRSDGKHDRRSHTEGWKRGLGWQGQQSGLWPHLSIRQQCYLLQDERNQSSLESFAEALSMVPLLDRMPHQLYRWRARPQRPPGARAFLRAWLRLGCQNGNRRTGQYPR